MIGRPDSSCCQCFPEKAEQDHVFLRQLMLKPHFAHFVAEPFEKLY